LNFGGGSSFGSGGGFSNNTQTLNPNATAVAVVDPNAEFDMFGIPTAKNSLKEKDSTKGSNTKAIVPIRTVARPKPARYGSNTQRQSLFVEKEEPIDALISRRHMDRLDDKFQAPEVEDVTIQPDIPRHSDKNLELGYYKEKSDFEAGKEMESLENLGSEELKKLKYFTVSHPEFGSVIWLEPVNVKGVDLNEIVEFGHKQIKFYESQKRPPPGTKLNKRTRITLRNIGPSKKSRMKKYESKLRATNESVGAKFISWKNGEWVFEVDPEIKATNQN